MQLFTVTEPVTLKSPRLIKHSFPGTGSNPEQLQVGFVYMVGNGEMERLRETVQAAHGEAGYKRIVKFFDDTRVGGWDRFPPRLGRSSLGFSKERSPRLHTEAAPLLDQLAWLAARKPGKSHLRLALVNGFGGNLGDSLTGATALRVLLRELRQRFQSFSIDLLLGMGSHQVLDELLRVGPEIEREYRGTITLADFARYDGYFDFTNLISYPRYYELPAVDFCLWWLGLDPDQVAAKDKRNALQLDSGAREQVAALLAPLQRPLLLFNHKASVALRSFPDQEARSFIANLRKQAPEVGTIVLNHALEFDADPQVVNLSKEITSVERLKALVAQVDGVITVETFALHLADACAVPTVVLVASTPVANSVRNYPHCRGLQLPGAESLPGWMRAKVSATLWPTMAEAYAKAWGQVSAAEVLQCLGELQAAHPQKVLEMPAQIQATPPFRPPAFATLQSESWPPRLHAQRRVQSPGWREAQDELHGWASRTLQRGAAAILVGGAPAEVALALAARLGCEGQLHVFEPRRLYHQLLCANAMLANIDWLHTCQALPQPAPASGRIEIVDLDMFSSHQEQHMGNLGRRVSPDCKPIDALALPYCQLLFVQPPFQASAVLAGAQQTLARTRPVILLAHVPAAGHQQIADSLADLDYRLFVRKSATPQAGPLLCVPDQRYEELASLCASLAPLARAAQ